MKKSLLSFIVALSGVILNEFKYSFNDLDSTINGLLAGYFIFKT